MHGCLATSSLYSQKPPKSPLGLFSFRRILTPRIALSKTRYEPLNHFPDGLREGGAAEGGGRRSLPQGGRLRERSEA